MTSKGYSPAVEARAMTLADLLREGKFEMPWHQRYYDWSCENVKDLLLDLDEAISAEVECYFLDSIKLAGEKDEHWQVNDGQQRLVTFSLICAWLARAFQHRDPRREGHAMRLLFELQEAHTESLETAASLDTQDNPSTERQGELLSVDSRERRGKKQEAHESLGGD